jgi:hypothetical protein
MKINFAPVDEALLKQLVAEAVRFAVKKLLHDSPVVASPFYAAVDKGRQSLYPGKGIEYSPELEEEIWQEGLARAEAGRKPNPDVIPE